MKEIIAGAGGFLGSNLRRHFGNKGKEVVVLPSEMLLDIGGMHELLKVNEPYRFYYLAAYGNLRGQNDIQEIYRAIINKLLNVLQATEGTDCRSFITAGSTSEYGNKDVPMTEDMILEPDGFYGAAKAGATQLALVWAKKTDTPTIVFRPSSMTGVGEQPIHLIPTLIRSCLLKEPIPFVAEAYHDYINVLDVCSALEILADKAKEVSGQVFNVGIGSQVSNEEIKNMLESITGQKAVINKAVRYKAEYASEVWIADSTKMRNLGWKPNWTIMQTLKEMVRSA